MRQLTQQELDKKLKEKSIMFVGLKTKKMLKEFKDLEGYYYVDSNPRKDLWIDLGKKTYYLYKEKN